MIINIGKINNGVTDYYKETMYNFGIFKIIIRKGLF